MGTWSVAAQQAPLQSSFIAPSNTDKHINKYVDELFSPLLPSVPLFFRSPSIMLIYAFFSQSPILLARSPKSGYHSDHSDEDEDEEQYYEQLDSRISALFGISCFLFLIYSVLLFRVIFYL